MGSVVELVLSKKKVPSALRAKTVKLKVFGEDTRLEVQTSKFQPSEMAARLAPLSNAPPLCGKEPSAFGLIRAVSSEVEGGGVGASACATPNELTSAIAAIPASLRYLRALL